MSARLARRLGWLVMAGLALAACQHRAPATSQELAGDLRSYLDQLRVWEPLEKEVFGALADVERTQWVDDDFILRRFKGARPRIHEHVEELDAFSPQTPDLRVVHERYREGWQDLGAGFDAVIGAVEAKDYVKLASAKNQVVAARRKLLGAFQEIDAMLAETEPELKKLRRADDALSS